TEYFAKRLHRIELLHLLGKLASERQNQWQGKLLLLKDKLQTLFPKGPPRDVAHLISRLTIDLPALRHLLHEQINHTFDAFAEFIQTAKQLSTDEPSHFEQKLRLLPDHQAHPKWQEEILPRTEQLIKAFRQYLQGLDGLESDLK